MSLLEAAAYAIGEASVHLVGWIVGQTFDVDERKAQRICEYLVLALIAGAAVAVTLMYS